MTRLLYTFSMSALVGGLVSAQEIPIPNSSFEFPGTTFVDIEVADWQKASKPFWYDESEGFFWDQLVGVFRNTSPENEDHIPNTHLQQGLFLFALPEVGIHQILRDEKAVYEPGKSYRLTVGLIGGGGAMREGVALGMQLVYEKDQGELVVVSERIVRHATQLFPTTTSYVDQSLISDPVGTEDAWSGRAIGIRFLSLTAPELAGGFWDLDHVRLEPFLELGITSPVWSEGAFSFEIRGEIGKAYQILHSSEIARPVQDWLVLDTVDLLETPFRFNAPASNASSNFYAIREVGN